MAGPAWLLLLGIIVGLINAALNVATAQRLAHDPDRGQAVDRRAVSGILAGRNASNTRSDCLPVTVP
jgi:hypothetical protein